VRRALPLVVVLALAGCGGGASGDEDTPATTARPATTTTEAEPPLSNIDAVRETQSIASQEAFKRDFSFPTTAIDATCSSLEPTSDGRGRFACTYTSPKDSCRGKVVITRLADGSNGTGGFTIKCSGPPNIGPDTSDPNFNPDG
jgi:hypothetical protein